MLPSQGSIPRSFADAKKNEPYLKVYFVFWWTFAVPEICLRRQVALSSIDRCTTLRLHCIRHRRRSGSIPHGERLLRTLPARRPQAKLAVPVSAPASLKTIINRFLYARSPLRVRFPTEVQKKRSTPKGILRFLVTPRGIEPRSSP